MADGVDKTIRKETRRQIVCNPVCDLPINFFEVGVKEKIGSLGVDI